MKRKHEERQEIDHLVNRQRSGEQDTYVAPSTLGKHAGLGLFANRDFKNGETICEYAGRLVEDTTELTEEQRRYTLQISRRWCIDASDLKTSSMGRYANECREKDKKRLKRLGLSGNNGRFSCNHRTKRAKIIAIRVIHKHDEVFVSYGADYWCGRNSVDQ